MKISEIVNTTKKHKTFTNFKDWRKGVSDSCGDCKMEDDRMDKVKTAIKNGIIVGKWFETENEGWVVDYDYAYGRMTISKLRKLFEV